MRIPTRHLATGLAVLTAAVIAGCGSESSETAAPPPPPSGAAGTGGGKTTVVPEGTEGRVGPAERVTKAGTEIIGREGKIDPKANRPTKAQGKGVAAAGQCADSDATPTADNLGAMAQSVLCLVNAERVDKGLGALTQNGQLDRAAQGMADEMVAKQFFSHTTPDGRNLADRIEPTGYIPNGDDWVVGENLGWGSGGLSTPRAIVNGWMDSPGHRANILDGSYKDIGLGTKMGSPQASVSGGTVYVHNFGARSGASGSGGDGASSAQVDTGQSVAGTSTKAKKKKKKKRKKRRR